MPPSATYILSNEAWVPKTGALVEDLGFPEPAASQATFTTAPGDSALLRVAPNGEVALALTGEATAAGTGLGIRPFSDAEVDSWVNAAGKCARIRHKVIFEKGTNDGTVTTTTGRIVFGTTSGTRLTHIYGNTGAVNDGLHLHLTPVSSTNFYTNRRLRWGVVHLVDIWIENLDGTNYQIITFVDGQFLSYYTTTTASQVRGHIRCVWDGALGSGGTPTHWINWLGMKVDLFASGGFAGNWEGIAEVDNGGRYDLPAYADDSVVTLHGTRFSTTGSQNLSSGSGVYAFDACLDWPNGVGLSGTLSQFTDLDYNNVLVGAPRLVWANPAGTVNSRLFRRPRQDGMSCARFVIRQFGDSQVEFMLHSQDGTPEVGFLVPEGTSNTTLRLRFYDGFAYKTVNTGIPIVRDNGYVIHLSFVEGRGVGVSVNNLAISGSTAQHIKSFMDDGTYFSGLPSEIGYLRLTATLNIESATPLSFWGPQFGARLAIMVESSYTNSAVGGGGLVSPVSTIPSYWARFAYDAEAGRGEASSGHNRRSRPAGAFAAWGRSGMSLAQFIFFSLDNNVPAWIEASAAFPLHITDGKINSTVSTPNDITAIVASHTTMINAYRADGKATLLVGPTPSPAAFSSYVADRVANHLAFNQWLRDLNDAGGLAGMDFFDLAEYFGGEAEATEAVSLHLGNVHPQGNGGRIYQLAIYDSAREAFTPTVASGFGKNYRLLINIDDLEEGLNDAG